MKVRAVVLSLSIVVVSAGGAVSAATSLSQVRNLCKQTADKSRNIRVTYKFNDEYLTLQAQADKRAKEAAKVWAALKPDEKLIAVIGRSPFGGGERTGGYWPAGIDESVLGLIVKPLEKLGVKCALPDLASKTQADTAPMGATVKPFPKVGFSQDYKFVMVIGFHCEPVPYHSGRYRVRNGVVYSRASRVNAWAILFYCPTGIAFWAEVSSATADFHDGDNPVDIAARRALASLDFSKLGSDNVPAFIRKFAQVDKFEALDIADVLVQTQRADAVRAVINSATSAAGYRTTLRVLRYYNQRGVVQDYRVSPDEAKKRKYVLISQPVMMKTLLMERLRGIRGIQPCVVAAMVDRRLDYRIPALGRRYITSVGPVCPDDEIVLISELANRDPRGIFRWSLARAVRALGRCRNYADEALIVAKYYAARKSRLPRRGRKPRRDPVKQAARWAIEEIHKVRAKRPQDGQ